LRSPRQDRAGINSLPTLSRLADLFPGLLLSEPMLRHTSFCIGGPADALYVPRDLADLRAVLGAAQQLAVPITIMGAGSNLLVRDGGIRGLVVKIAGTFDQVSLEGTRMTAGAGAQLSTLARRAAEAGLAGLEFASGIPGALGGALSMNAGAYGGEMKDVVRRVRVLRDDGMETTLSAEEMLFGYRQSVLQHQNLVALEAEMELTIGDMAEISAKIEELNRRRREKQPLTLPSAGSVFKRPPGNFAGTLIEQAGLKGCRIGGAEVSTLHAGFIVNVGNATAKDVELLIRHVQQVVQEKSGVSLETEIRILGEE